MNEWIYEIYGRSRAHELEGHSAQKINECLVKMTEWRMEEKKKDGEE